MGIATSANPAKAFCQAPSRRTRPQLSPAAANGSARSRMFYGSDQQPLLLGR